jgi:hypothetical protein
MGTFAPKQKQAPQRTSSDIASRKAPAHSINHQERRILDLQRTIGSHTGPQAGEAVSTSGTGAAAGHARFTYNFASIPIFHTPVRGTQLKLAVNTPGDEYEQEADRVSEQVMRMSEAGANVRGAPAPSIVFGGVAGLQRKCACGGTCDDCKKKHPEPEHAQVRLKAAGPASTGGIEAPPIVHEVLRTPGQPLDVATRAFMEPRFGWDFSKVRVHTDGKAGTSTRSIQALAYTSGHDIVFNNGQYSPHTERGKRLLAHELAHVVQQRSASQGGVARFSDDTHNIIEEAALTLAGMKAEEIEQVHKGNTKRDYSQSPGVLNLLLLCEPSTFGGYKDYEHFDNFQWSEELQKWQSRENPELSKKTPISHISDELMAFVGALPEKGAFQHVGNAFHAVEDFFAHSNFVELLHGDFRHGNKLITGSVGKSDDVSLLKILESVSSQETAPLYGAQATKGIAEAPPGSHPRMAKDYKSIVYQMEAMVLAGLVIKELGTNILALQGMKTKEAQSEYVSGVIMAKVKRYLRPPDDNDKWWERLRASGGAEMEKSIRETRARTPVTKNQCFLSPLRSIEASRDSNMKLFGPAFPLQTKGGHVWVQVGTGFSTTPAFNKASGEPEPRSMDFMRIGVQITGHFDLFGGK